MCVGCQEMHNKRDLMRIVRTPEGEFVVDITGKKSGRGAYICKNVDCFNKAVKSKGFERSFKGAIDTAVCESLREKILQNNG